MLGMAHYEGGKAEACTHLMLDVNILVYVQRDEAPALLTNDSVHPNIQQKAK
jgi:hypothetical protein